eukprot:scaffold85110_cov34-Prasinocladus_malaysianus.AAC.1
MCFSYFVFSCFILLDQPYRIALYAGEKQESEAQDSYKPQTLPRDAPSTTWTWTITRGSGAEALAIWTSSSLAPSSVHY